MDLPAGEVIQATYGRAGVLGVEKSAVGKFPGHVELAAADQALDRPLIRQVTAHIESPRIDNTAGMVGKVGARPHLKRNDRARVNHGMSTHPADVVGAHDTS